MCGRTSLFVPQSVLEDRFDAEAVEPITPRYNIAPGNDLTTITNVCPYSYYPHAIQRGAIAHHLSRGLRPDMASERFNVSIQTIKKHYDPRTKRKRKEDRSEAVRNSWSD